MARTPYPAGVAADFQSVIGISLGSDILVSVGCVDDTSEGGALVESQDSVSAPSTQFPRRWAA
jgi:hypothetical protein